MKVLALLPIFAISYSCSSGIKIFPTRTPTSETVSNCYADVSSFARRAHQLPVGKIHRYETPETIEISTKAYSQINEWNVFNVFSHRYEKGKEFFGTKAVILEHDDHYTLKFWATGKDGTGNNIHHRDALATMLSAKTERYLEREQENQWEVAFNEQDEFLNRGRRNDSYSDSLLERSMGLQFTMKNNRIIYIDFDSSMTSAQVQRGVGINSQKIVLALKRVLLDIDSSLLDLKNIRIKGLNRLIEQHIIKRSELQSQIDKALEEQGLKRVKVIDFNRSDRLGYDSESESSPSILLSFIKLRSRSKSFALSTIFST